MVIGVQERLAVAITEELDFYFNWKNLTFIRPSLCVGVGVGPFPSHLYCLYCSNVPCRSLMNPLIMWFVFMTRNHGEENLGGGFFRVQADNLRLLTPAPKGPIVARQCSEVSCLETAHVLIAQPRRFEILICQSQPSLHWHFPL